MIFTSKYLLEKVFSQSCVYFFVGTSASRARIIAIKCLSLLLAKKKREALGDFTALVISDTAQINRIISRVVKAEKRKGKLTRWTPRLQRTNGQFSIVRASLGFLLNTAFHPSYALSFVSPVYATVARILLSIPVHVHAKHSLRKIATEFRHCHRKARWMWNYWRAKRASCSFLRCAFSLIHRSLEYKKENICATRLAKFQYHLNRDT